MRQQREHDLQRSCVMWFRLQYPGRVIFAIPNGGGRSKAEAGRLKAEGVLAGVPDLFIAEAAGQWHGLFIEMKDGKNGRLSPSQKAIIPHLRDNGYLCQVCRDFDTFRDTVNAYFTT